jgi:DNA mismatch repair protein MutL
MSDIIQLLPDSVANQIAAGEVIQRPSSVIKELVENAVDAGAKTINVLVVDAGRTSIQVIDDGKGMSETDARLSFERHATSKIRKADDLFALHTMGFRGEALASIAAVAQIELKTRQAGEDVGTYLSISGSKFTGQEPCSCSEGSNFNVENLFFNVPARRKFLKSNSTELNNILTAFERIVLVNPQISFTLHSNGAEMFNLKACGLRQRIVDVFGKRLNQDLLPVNVDTTMCKISGFVGKPESARKKGVHQYFFANGRYMKHPYFNKAVLTAFDRLIPMGEQVPYFIYFEVPAEDIDVNIHPTKTEIKFENEQAIWQILTAAVKESIGVFNEVPSIDFDTQGRPEIPVYNPENSGVPAPKVNYNPQYNPFQNAKQNQQPQVPDQWEQLYEGLKSQKNEQHSDIFGTQTGIFEQQDETENVEKSLGYHSREVACTLPI